MQIGATSAAIHVQSDRPANGLRLESGEIGHGGALWALFDSREQAISTNALSAWLTGSGHEIVYATPGGAGGYENEGQSLWIHDVATGQQRCLMAAVFAIDDVRERASRSGRRALIVLMHDSGLGASHIAVVDPARGEVYVTRKARILDDGNGRLALARYDNDDWDELLHGRTVQPRRVERLGLDELLSRPVIDCKAPH